MAERYQRSRAKGARLPEKVVCVTRPGRWGNPFETAEEFRAALISALEGEPTDRRVHRIAMTMRELQGKDLACWCSLTKPCHADVYLELCNSLEWLEKSRGLETSEE